MTSTTKVTLSNEARSTRSAIKQVISVAALNSKEVNGVLIVGFSSSKLLFEDVIQEVGSELVEKISEAKEGKKILLTFDGVSFMSSSMLGRLVLFLKKCKREDVEMKVCSITPEIFEVFKITNLDQVFDIAADQEEALAGFAE